VKGIVVEKTESKQRAASLLREPNSRIRGLQGTPGAPQNLLARPRGTEGSAPKRAHG